MTIDKNRQSIDEIDDKMLELLNKRAQCAIDIGKLKKKQDLPVYDPAREKKILGRLIANNPGPLDNRSILTLFERIIDESRRIERQTSDKIENNNNL